MKNSSIKGSRRLRSKGRTKALASLVHAERSSTFCTAESSCMNSQKLGKSGEANYVSVRSSINQLFDVMCKFDDQKRALVKSIGFGGMLSFPPIRQVNRKFGVWLMNRVDPLVQTLVIDDVRKIKFTKDDVALVFGIPSRGRCVSDCAMPRKETVSKILSSFLGIGEKDNRSIKAVLEVIERDYAVPMMESEESAFKVAFVIYVMSTLLAPGAKHDYPSVDYWNALLVPNEIHLYDWSQYVIHRLFDAVVKVKADLKKYGKVTSLTGCCLFLQVFYLDSIDLGVLNLQHDAFPRVSQFKPEMMKSMIFADSVYGTDDPSVCSFGKSKLRAVKEVCYHWAQDSRPSSSNFGCFLEAAPWKVEAAMASSLNLPLEVAGVIHCAVNEFEKERCSRILFPGIDCISTIFAVIQPFVFGYRYRTISHCNIEVLGKISSRAGLGIFPSSLAECPSSSESSGNSSMVQEPDVDRTRTDHCSSHSKRSRICQVGLSSPFPENPLYRRFFNTVNNVMLDSVVASAVDSVDRQYQLQIRCLALKAMSRYYIAVCESKGALSSRVGGSYSPGSDGSESIDGLPRYWSSCKTPWDLGLRRAYAEVELDLFAPRPLLSNNAPRLQLSNSAHDVLELQFNGNSEIEMDVFEDMLGFFKDIDMELYSLAESNRWRHFVTPHFLESILASMFSVDDRCSIICSSWVRAGYDVSKCKMIFFPALMEQRWICYAWDIARNSIAVYDPYTSQSSSSWIFDLHCLVAKSLKFAMHEVVNKLRLEFPIDFHGASVWFVKAFTDPSFCPRTCMNRSGVLCLQFCFSFDGSEDSVRDRLVYSDRVIRMMHGDLLDFLARESKY